MDTASLLPHLGEDTLFQRQREEKMTLSIKGAMGESHCRIVYSGLLWKIQSARISKV